MTLAQEIKSEIHIPFILAGNAFVWVYSRRKNVGIEYKIQKHKEKDLWFVSVEYHGRKDPTNECEFESSHYSYVGMLNESFRFIRTRKSPFCVHTRAFDSFGWVWTHLTKGTLPEFMAIKHIGRCGRCGYKLKTEQSVERGFGPHCWRRIMGKKHKIIRR